MAESYNILMYLTGATPPPATEIVGVDGFDNSSGILTWTDDLADISENTTTVDGDYVTYNSEVMNHFPFNKITEVTDDNGNVFTRFPKMWMKWITNDSSVITGVRFSNEQVDSEYFIPDCFLDPQDTTGSTYLDYVDIGKYEGSGSSSMVYSKSGQTCLVSITRANCRTGCRAYGTSSDAYNGYQQLDLSILTLYNFLVHTLTKTANIQNIYAGRTNVSSAYTTGSCDGVNGFNGWNTSSTCVKFLGVENPYGNITKWVDGVYFSSSTIYAHRFPTQYADSTSNANALGFSRPTSSGYITALRSGTTEETRSFVYASAASGSDTTYYGDYCYYDSSGVVLFNGGAWSYYPLAGLWCLYGYSIASSTGTNIGCRLSRRPI